MWASFDISSRRCAVLLGLALLGGCDDDSKGRTTPQASDFCSVMAGYIPECGEFTPCEQGFLRDCKAIQKALAEPTVAALTSCIRQLGTPPVCLDEAVGATPSSPAFESYVATLCLECGDGAGSCQQDILANKGHPQLQRMSRLARIIHPQLLNGLAQECTLDDTCGPMFEDCAKGFMARFVPPETADCVVETVLDGATSGCMATGGDDQSDGLTGSGDDTSDTGDTGEPACIEAGCPCLFHEDCDQAAGLACIEEFCALPAMCINDSYEPNDTEASAAGIPGVTDADAAGNKVNGELDGLDDVDWFTFAGEDAVGGLVNPAAKTSNPDLQLCVHAVCRSNASATKVTCPPNTTKQASPGGVPGCCGFSQASGIELKFEGCTKFNLGSDDAIVYVKVSGGESNQCLPYTMSYHF